MNSVNGAPCPLLTVFLTLCAMLSALCLFHFGFFLQCSDLGLVRPGTTSGLDEIDKNVMSDPDEGAFRRSAHMRF